MDIVQPGKAIGFVPAGAPHHLTQDYGWWHVNDTEEIYVPVPLVNGALAYRAGVEFIKPDALSLDAFCLRRITTSTAELPAY